MTDLTPQMDVALAESGVIIFMCGQIDFPGYTLRLLESSGEVTWGGNTFKGSDPRFGVIESVDAISDGMGDQAPTMSITLIPPSDTVAADLCAPDMQGSRIRMWLGAIVDGAVIASPYLLFDGIVDQPSLSIQKSSRVITYECVSQFEYLFIGEEGARLSDTNQQAFWAGDTFLSDVTSIVKNVLWGPGESIAGSPSSGGNYNAGFGGGSPKIGYDVGKVLNEF